MTGQAAQTNHVFETDQPTGSKKFDDVRQPGRYLCRV